VVESKAERSAPEDKEFASNMKRIREMQNMSQGELARRITDLGVEGFHQTTVSRIEKGERLVRLGEARHIARALGRPIEHLLTPHSEIEPIERLDTDLKRLSELRNSIPKALQEYESLSESMLDQLVKMRDLLQGDIDFTQRQAAYRLVERGLASLHDYRLDNVASWPELGQRKMKDLMEERTVRVKEFLADGEHQEKS
jgi:transcriptional regulator with XRE-family HTH domain